MTDAFTAEDFERDPKNYQYLENMTAVVSHKNHLVPRELSGEFWLEISNPRYQDMEPKEAVNKALAAIADKKNRPMPASLPILAAADLAAICLTSGQRTVVVQIIRHFDVFRVKSSLGGYSLRPPLVIGPSGAGKTMVLRVIGALRNMPLLLLDTSSWLPIGAHAQPATLQVIADFVLAHPEGIIAVDEVDKFGGSDSEGWWRSIRGEAMMVIERRVDTFNWHSLIKDTFMQRFFIIGLGTWQELHRQTPAIGFAKGIQKAPGFDELRQSKAIPEELLARFAEPIHLNPPNARDFEEAIRRILTEAGAAADSQEIKHLCEMAMASGKHTRWLQDFAASQILDAVPDPVITKKIDLPTKHTPIAP